MFRKKQIKVLRIKDGERRLFNADYPWNAGELTYASEVMRFLKSELDLKSVQILGGQIINLFSNESHGKFCDYFRCNETVDILIPNSANLAGWELEPGRYV